MHSAGRVFEWSGDPSAVGYAHATVKELIEDYPTFSICLSHQIIASALGAKTFKLKFATAVATSRSRILKPAKSPSLRRTTGCIDP